MNPTVLIYGATGYTGNLVALHARVTGLSFEIGGRNASLVAVRAGLAGVTAVLNCAGPFAGTAHALMDACIASGVHYLDITAAYKVYALAEASSARAQDANVMLLPGVGWDVVPSDALRCTSPPKSTGRSACASRCRWPIRCRAVRPAAWLKSSACDFGASAVAEVTGIDGAVVRARIDTVNGYTYTPLAAVAALHLVLADQVRSGFQTPYPASGAGFAATIADTRIVDMV